MSIRTWVAARRFHVSVWWDELTYGHRERRGWLAYTRRARRRRATERLRATWFALAQPIDGHRLRVHRRRRAGWEARLRPLSRFARWIIILLAGLVIVLAFRSVQLARPSSGRPSAAGSARAVSGVAIPNVIGLSASDARARLERLGLSLERAVPAVGTPGLVLGTVPTIGRSVRSGTAVVMIVGVESSRFEPADRTSSASRR